MCALAYIMELRRYEDSGIDDIAEGAKSKPPLCIWISTLRESDLHVYVIEIHEVNKSKISSCGTRTNKN